MASKITVLIGGDIITSGTLRSKYFSILISFKKQIFDVSLN